MINRRIIFAGCAVIAVAALLLAYGLAENWPGAVAALGAGLAGVFGWYGKDKNRSDWGINSFWVGIILLVTLGALLDLNAFLLVIAVVSGLGAWDVVRFHKSVADFSASEKILQIEKRHLALLGGTLLAGGILAFAVAGVRIQITFFLSLVLGVILIFALSGIIRLLHK